MRKFSGTFCLTPEALFSLYYIIKRMLCSGRSYYIFGARLYLKLKQSGARIPPGVATIDIQ